MNRFYVSKDQIVKERITIHDRQDARHLIGVLHLKKGEELYVSDGEGSAYLCELDEAKRQSVILRIKKRLSRLARDQQKVLVSLACAVPKNTRFEEVVDKGTQLGVDEIIPLFTGRTVVKKEAFDKKRGRFERILLAAAKQSGALFLPHLRDSVVFHDLFKKTLDYHLMLLPNLSSKSKTFKEALQELKGRRLLILIGPEGDFSPEEIKEALKAGCQGVSLGESVLRVDTAAIAALSFVRLYF
jgi:16S rRNA (uracil1498-N3)-methyltransferase